MSRDLLLGELVVVGVPLPGTPDKRLPVGLGKVVQLALGGALVVAVASPAADLAGVSGLVQEHGSLAPHGFLLGGPGPAAVLVVELVKGLHDV